jgi:hypothetical protein
MVVFLLYKFGLFVNLGIPAGAPPIGHALIIWRVLITSGLVLRAELAI